MNFRLVWIVLCSLVAVACGAEIKATARSGPTPDDNGAVLVAKHVANGMGGGSYYVSAVQSVPTGVFDSNTALELSSADLAVFNGQVYARDRSAQTITRYTVAADLSLSVDAILSFAASGFSGRVYDAYVSPTLAYAIDGTNMQLVAWNPTSMQLTGNKIDLSSLSKANMDTSFGVPLRVGPRVYVQIAWADASTGLYYPKMAVMMIDGLGGLPAIIEDARVGSGYALYVDGNGSLYAPGLIGGDFRKFGTPSNGTSSIPPDGVLKLTEGASAFDASYMVNLTSIIGSPSIYAAHRVDDTHVLAQVIDPSTDTSAYQPGDYSGSQGYIFVLVDTSSKLFPTVTSIAKGYAANSLPHVVDGTAYVQTVLPDLSGADVHGATGATVNEAFTLPGGDLWHLERVR